MEQEHPIPQQISSYQFRLVGDMTLNQFFQVAGGALVSLAIYSSALPGYFKTPLIILSFLMGIAFAFFPLQDRPLATWLVLFFKAIYSPTIYVWKKGAEKRDFFVPEATSLEASTTQPAAQEKIETPTLPSKLESTEEAFLSKLEKQMEQPNIIVPPPVSRAPEIATAPVTTPTPREKDVQIPAIEAVKVDVSREEVKNTIEVNMTPSGINEGYVPTQSQNLTGVKLANFVPEASPPLPPTIPNVVVGQVLDPNGKIIDGAIIEILDQAGRPLRALKSNKLGHFMIVTPLSNGTFNLITEKEGYEFDTLQLETKGEIIMPIAIISKRGFGQINPSQTTNI